MSQLEALCSSMNLSYGHPVVMATISELALLCHGQVRVWKIVLCICPRSADNDQVTTPFHSFPLPKLP